MNTQTQFLDHVTGTWVAGGWVMIPLLVLALMMFYIAGRMILNLQHRGFQRLEEHQWLGWIRNPQLGEGEVGEMIRYTQDEVCSVGDIQNRFAEVKCAELPVIDRQLSTLSTVVSAAPLVGLLGTVFGMLVTFQALAAGGGGKVTEAMASGIAQALFPPEVGLCIALPGLILIQWIKRRRQEYAAFLAQLESRTIQHFNKTLSRLEFEPAKGTANKTVETFNGNAMPTPATA